MNNNTLDLGDEVVNASFDYMQNFDYYATCVNSLFPTQCGPSDEDVMWIKITEGHLALVVSLFGIVGNITSLVVLCEAPKLDLFTRLLVSLSICDLIFLSKSKYPHVKQHFNQ